MLCYHIFIISSASFVRHMYHSYNAITSAAFDLHSSIFGVAKACIEMLFMHYKPKV